MTKGFRDEALFSTGVCLSRCIARAAGGEGLHIHVRHDWAARPLPRVLMGLINRLDGQYCFVLSQRRRNNIYLVYPVYITSRHLWRLCVPRYSNHPHISPRCRCRGGRGHNQGFCSISSDETYCLCKKGFFLAFNSPRKKAEHPL